MDALAVLRLQLDWGADEALLGAPTRPRSALPVAHAAPAEATVRSRPISVARGRTGAEPGRDPRGGDVSTARELASGAVSAAALREMIRRFDPDGLAATATALVFPEDATPVPLAVIGDAPGADEDRAGTPFSGQQGFLLERMLASIGLQPGDAACVHVVPWRPPGGREVSEVELAAYLPFLQRLIVLRGCRWLLLLGTAPTRALLGRASPPSRLRGSWRPVTLDVSDGASPPVQALATHGLAQVMQRPELKAVVWRDLRMLRRTLDG